MRDDHLPPVMAASPDLDSRWDEPRFCNILFAPPENDDLLASALIDLLIFELPISGWL
jgi:hypothetical protein